MCSVGGNHEVKSEPRSLDSGEEGTESLAIDKAIFRMVSKSSGRNEQ